MPGKKESRKIEALPSGVKTGYRSCRIDWGKKEGDVPKLQSLGAGSDYRWSPGENVSSLEPGEDIEESPKGFYMKKSIRDLKSEGYKGPGLVTGAILPYGKVLEGEEGYRASKALIDTLFISGNECQICGKEESEYLLPGKVICGKKCYERIKKALEKKGVDPAVGSYANKEYKMVLKDLADRYGVQLIEMPPEENW